MIIRSSIRSRYTIVCNESLNDPRLSFGAKGLLCYLLSKPDSWKIKTKELMDAGDCGRDKILSMMKELSSAGYVSMRVIRGKGGRLLGKEVVLHETPIEVTAEDREIKPSDEPTIGKGDPLVITDVVVKTEEVVSTKKAVSTEAAQAPPSFIDPVLWKDWVEHRKEMKRPLTSRAERQLLTRLEAIHRSGRDPNEAIRYSLANGWRGVFEDRERKPVRKSGISDWLAERSGRVIDA